MALRHFHPHEPDFLARLTLLVFGFLLLGVGVMIVANDGPIGGWTMIIGSIHSFWMPFVPSSPFEWPWW